MSPVLTRTIDNAACTGRLLDQGALVLDWAPRGAAAALFSASNLIVEPGVAPHAGIPVCWPWFGPGRRPGAPSAHGFARGADWELVQENTDETATTFLHRLTQEHVTSEFWPYPYRLELKTSFGADLELELSTTNTGQAPFQIEEALHTYLAVSDVRRIRVEGLGGATYYDKVSATRHEQSGPLRIAGEVDSVYVSSNTVQVIDPDLDRRLTISTDGARNQVIWNPGEIKGSALTDVGQEWPRFLCIEGANVLANAVTVAPGQTHTLSYRVSVSPL